jgi:hypothetical protein
MVTNDGAEFSAASIDQFIADLRAMILAIVA